MLGTEKVNFFHSVLNRLMMYRSNPVCVCDKSVKFYQMSQVVNSLNRPTSIRIGAHSHIKGELLVFGHGGDISLGSYCYLGENSKIWSAKKIEIGDRVLISHNVNIFDNLVHPMNPELRHSQFVSIITSGQPKQIDGLDEKSVKIEDDVLIGAMALVLRGVTIGEGSVVGAGSVVTKDVPPYTIVAGNPAHVLRKISDNELNYNVKS